MAEREHASLQQESYDTFLASYITETLQAPEFADLRNWYEEQLAAQQEMDISDASLTDSRSWNAEYIQNPEDQTKYEVKTIISNFFKILGKRIRTRKPDGSLLHEWTQPGIFQETTPILIPSPEGPKQIDASGFVGIIMDDEGKTLITLGQEPFARAPKHTLIRTVAQTSATKLKELLAGGDQYDPRLATLLKKIGGGKALWDMFASGEIQTFPLSPADANRISATNFGFLVRVTDPQLREELTDGGKNRWCTHEEIQALTHAALINGHTIVAYHGAREVARRQSAKSV